VFELSASKSHSLAVKAHVSRLLAKLGADNRVQIALMVQEAAANRPLRAL
jgi:DNA-binding NarL/FixJ family response regulator